MLPHLQNLDFHLYEIGMLTLLKIGNGSKHFSLSYHRKCNSATTELKAWNGGVGTKKDKNFFSKFSQTVYFHLPDSRYEHKLFSSQPAACIVNLGKSRNEKNMHWAYRAKEVAVTVKERLLKGQIKLKIWVSRTFQMLREVCRKHSVIVTHERPV